MSASSYRRRYLSVWLRRLATDRLIRRRSPAVHVGCSRFAQEADEPLVIAEPVKGALRARNQAEWEPVSRPDCAQNHKVRVRANAKPVPTFAARTLAAVNDAAARLGLKTGMALADARAMYPGLIVADADPAADRHTLEAIADWCDRYTPLVGLDPPDGLVFDIAGCAHLFGGEEALCRDILERLAAQGFHARVAAADTVGCAWAAARYGTLSIVPSEQTRDVLLPLPLAALRIAPERVSELAQVGLKHIADVIDRPRAPLAARFGKGFVRRLDQALGREEEPIAPRLPVPPYVAERRFAEPIAREADVLGTIEHLAQELSHLMERRGEGARIIEAALFRTDGKVFRLAAGAAAPLRDVKRMRALFVERLKAIGDEWDPGFGFDVVRLGALAAERCDPAQTGIATPDHAAELAHLVDRLGARFGLRRVTRLVPQDTHIPEFAVTAIAAVNGAAALKRVIPAERSESRDPTFRIRRTMDPRSRSLASAGMTRERFAQDSLAPIRPVRLFEQPEPIEAIAEVPDGPPVQFIWRRVRHLVVHAEGPERIAMQWWRDQEGRALTRDYFRIESREGMRVWLYREGLYGREPGPRRWFLHGLFA
jgi:protein ImuB